MSALPTVAPVAAAPDGRLPALDGLRGLAILLVIGHNLDPLTKPDGFLSHVMASALDRGWVGVQLFFVLSGFLITGILIDSRRDPNHLANFYISRAFRILPLYYATLLVVFGLLPLLNVHIVWPGSVWPLALFVSNWVQPFHSGNPLPHFWSLAVEEQFYLLWPFVIRSLAHRGIVVLGLALTAIAFAIRLLLLRAGFSSEAVYEFSVCRMDALACGAAAAALIRMPRPRAWLVAHPLRTLAVALLLLAAAGTAGGYTQYAWATETFGYPLLSFGFAALVLMAASADIGQWPSRWIAPLRHRGLRRVGLYSYAMYVLHVPLHVFVGMPLMKAWKPGCIANMPGALLYVLGGTAVTFACGALSYRCFEVHFVRMKARWRHARGVQPAGPAVIA